MRRVLLIAVLAVGALALPSAAQATDPPVPPAFAPPVVAPVVDVPTAEAFAKAYATENARSFLRERRRNRVRVIDAASRCLQSPVLATRFGCVFTLRALVIQRRNGWDNWGHGSKLKSRRGHHRPRPRFRIRNFGCLGFLRVNGGPAVTPTGELVAVECARVPRGDIVAPEPVL